jgi:hypothetical protein
MWCVPGTDLSLLNYDVHYALRVCREYNRVEACVTLCCVLGLWEAAVDLALTNLDIDVAKQTALLPNVHDGQPADLKRRLWLKIAQHVVSILFIEVFNSHIQIDLRQLL